MTFQFDLRGDPKVYPPSDDSELLAQNLIINHGDHVLEIGVGSGYISLIASQKAQNIIAIDLNPIATRLTRENIRLNKVRNVDIICADLFGPLRVKFDLIIFNPPYLPDNHSEECPDQSWSGGTDGREVIERFLEYFEEYLKQDGRIQIIQSSLSNYEKTVNDLEKRGFIVEITEKKRLFFETLFLVTAQKAV